jgi:hypothetical protein
MGAAELHGVSAIPTSARVELVLTGRGWRQLGPSPEDRDGDLPTGAKRVELRLYGRELIRLDLQ